MGHHGKRIDHPNVTQVLAPDGTPQDCWVVKRGHLPALIVFDKQDALDVAMRDSLAPKRDN